PGLVAISCRRPRLRHERANRPDRRTAVRTVVTFGLASTEKLADIPGHPLAHGQLLLVAESQQPAVTAQRAHLPDMVDIDDGSSVHAPEVQLDEACFDG